jgi:hypothetical protein
LAVSELNFGDTLDTDYISQQFNKEANREFGKQYYADTQNFFSQGKFEVKTTLASTQLLQIENTGFSGICRWIKSYTCNCICISNRKPKDIIVHLAHVITHIHIQQRYILHHLLKQMLQNSSLMKNYQLDLMVIISIGNGINLVLEITILHLYLMLDLYIQHKIAQELFPKLLWH